ncbi:MAG: anaerobic glycerol-3-phosphate dehydrogenase subunit B [Alistipes sp.]|nr:anaerobic glycerol-3-phosphate dehydrogenase subunit B [Alistipes sp.]
MRYDTVIVGGGLTALMCGIELARNGRSVALVTTGHSSLHFSSCSLGLYNAAEPLKAIESLPQSHPYAKLGAEAVESYAARATEILNIAGIATNGTTEANHYIVTPMGQLRQCWLSLDGALTSHNGKELDYKSVALFYPEGFLDFYAQFICDTLGAMGTTVTSHTFSLPELVVRRNNQTEMRSIQVARALDKEENLRALASIISREAGDVEAVVLPATLGFDHADVRQRLSRMTDKEILYIPTLLTSVEGVKAERALRRTFESMGGTIFMGHTAVSHTTEEGLIASVTTSKGITLTAEEFVLASGSFIGGGLAADREGVTEGVFGADVIVSEGNQTTRDIFEPQPFMSCGVATDGNFKVLIGGKAVENLYACGAILSGYNPVKEGCGAGVAVTTALKVADDIINR